MREQFENLPRVKPILRLVKYSESSDGYDPLDQKSIYEKYADWLNGAWYTFQEHQKKIDALEKELEIRKQGASIMSWHREQILDMCESALRCSESIELNSVVGEIKELLK